MHETKCYKTLCGIIYSLFSLTVYFIQKMGLFLEHQTNLTVQVDSKEHIFRSHHAENGFISTPLVPKLKKDECTIAKVWNDTVEHNSYKPVFGYRPLIKVNSRTVQA
jgi:hypothetical protein